MWMVPLALVVVMGALVLKVVDLVILDVVLLMLEDFFAR